MNDLKYLWIIPSAVFIISLIHFSSQNTESGLINLIGAAILSTILFIATKDEEEEKK